MTKKYSFAAIAILFTGIPCAQSNVALDETRGMSQFPETSEQEPQKQEVEKENQNALSKLLDSFDEQSDLNLSGTLASLALAAAAFVVSLVPSLESDVAKARKAHRTAAGNADESKADEDKELAEDALKEKLRADSRLVSAKKATRSLIYSFGAFLTALLANLTVDPAAGPMSLVMVGHGLPVTDLLTSAVALGTGITFLCAGAARIYRLTLDPMEK